VANTIDGFQSNGAPTTSIGSRTTQSARGASAATADNAQSQNAQSGQNDEVQITSTASKLASLGQKLTTLPAVDADRVARISQSLENGTYSLSADKIAGGLLQSERALAQIGIQED
jgi:negative regulator of flagellin synthesis FlgM